MQRPISNCYWVVPDRFLAGEYPASIPQDGDPWEKASALAKAGVSVFVDLTEAGELRPYAHKIGDAKHLRFPIRIIRCRNRIGKFGMRWMRSTIIWTEGTLCMCIAGEGSAGQD